MLPSLEEEEEEEEKGGAVWNWLTIFFFLGAQLNRNFTSATVRGSSLSLNAVASNL